MREDPRFKNDPAYNYEQVIREMLERAQKPLCSTDAAIVLLEAYETKYGIYDHSTPDPARPLVNLAQHWAEDSTTGSVLHERFEQFEERKIFQRFGLSLTEFLNLPPDDCKKIMEIAYKRMAEDAKTADGLAAQLAAAQNQGGVPQ